MCTELFLALIYFITIIIVNYFLYNLIINYIKNIFYSLRIKNIFKNYPFNKTYSIFYKLSKKENKKLFLLKNLNQIHKNEDILILGNLYKYLDDNTNNSSNLNEFKTYYFSLLKSQYLSFNFNLK